MIVMDGRTTAHSGNIENVDTTRWSYRDFEIFAEHIGRLYGRQVIDADHAIESVDHAAMVVEILYGDRPDVRERCLNLYGKFGEGYGAGSRTR